MNDEKKTETIEIPAELLLDSINEVNQLYEGHLQILNSVKNLLHKYIEAGIPHGQAAQMAMELNKRAADKANKAVPHFDDATKKEAEQ